MRNLFLLITALFWGLASGQVTEQFSDGDYTQNPIWFGSGSQWAVDSLQLRSSATGANQRFFISTFSSPDTTLQLTVDVTLTFNPSSLNYVDVFVLSTDTNLLSTTSAGYFIRLGGTDDEIAFYRKEGPTNIKIIDGTNGVLNQAINRIRLELQKKPGARWVLSRIINDGPRIEEGSFTDNTYQTGVAFGFVIQQSTSSFFQRHYFDNIELGPYTPDTIAPAVDSIWVLSDQQVLVRFSEPMDTAGLFHALHYVVGDVGIPTYVEWASAQQNLIRLTFPNPIPTRRQLFLSVIGLKDRSGNSIRAAAIPFVFYVPHRYDILITEIMADPEPAQALPLVEWIELRNNTSFPISLFRWSITHSGGQSGYLPSITLLPDSLLILTSTSGALSMQPFRNVVAVSGFPTLYNEADWIVLADYNQQTIHSVHYDQRWHTNTLKQAGGWSLEMIDYNIPCSQANNWASSVSALGGTPAKNNSIDAVLPDESPPFINRMYTIDSMHIGLQFNETMDSGVLVNPVYYFMDQGIGHPASVSVLPPLFNKAIIRLAYPLLRETTYSIQIKELTDCAGNRMAVNEYSVALSESVLSGDIIINEVLFNPTSGAADYVELFNRSKRAINLADLLLANRNSLQQPDNYTAVCRENQICMPGDYWVITEDSLSLLREQPETDARRVLTVNNMPPYNDDRGVVLLIDKQGTIIDELQYYYRWHYPGLLNNEGVALERINPHQQTQDSTNWHSASATSGYGTPAQRNSQTIQGDEQTVDPITVYPTIISPNNDGADDVLQIQYRFLNPGNRARILLFDLSGNMITIIKHGFLCGTSGSVYWSGTDALARILPQAMYVVCVEWEEPNGNRRRKKIPVFVGR